MIANAVFADALTTTPFVDPLLARKIADELEANGAVRLPTLLPDETLRSMQEQFARRLEHVRWNNCDGHERTERYRQMVQDVLTLDQGFVDLALHPLVKGVLDLYLGPRYELCEAKGWQSLRTLKDFHGWHGDMWYDQTKLAGRIPREVKLAFYLSDVKSGAFQYLLGSHGKTPPRHLTRQDVEKLPLDRMVEFLGPAGSAVLFDTSGIHRQGIPILEPRQAVFYNYHDPDVPLQTEDVEYYRYHPLLLNAAFFGNLSQDDCRILGFGNQANYQPGFTRKSSHPRLQRWFERLLVANIRISDFTDKAWSKLRHLVGLRR